MSEMNEDEKAQQRRQRMRSLAIGIALAAISCMFWLFALPVMPLFAMTVILIDVFIIYALASYGMDTESAR